jgi:glycosyltransferase involved in cell wall biosynthesis
VPPVNDIICFANDWSGDPLSKKQIMTRLARRHRVLWVNSINNRRPRLAQKDFRRILEKLNAFRSGLQQVEERIWVLSPIFVPFHSNRMVRSFNRWLLGFQIRRALRHLGLTNLITYTFVPTSADVVGTLGEKSVVYHCVDEYSAFSDAAAEVRERETELLHKSDLVLVSASDLLKTKREHNPKTYLVTHGVDYEHFRRATDEATPVPPELRDLPRPILGFHGLIADWVDLPLLGELARMRPQWSIVLVGRGDTDLSPIQGLPNVHVLGHRPYTKLPEYLRGFDIALLPFVVNELTLAANPLKLREYLAAGLPVVAAPLPEIAKFEGLVTLASTAAEYASAIETLLAKKQVGPSPERSDQVAGESWDGKVAEIERLIKDVLASNKESDALIGGLENHPSLRKLRLELVSHSPGRHSEIYEYKSREGGEERIIVVKQITHFQNSAEAEEIVLREFRSLASVRALVSNALAASFPEPIAILREQNSIVMNKLGGTPFSTILRRNANRIAGSARQEAARAAAQYIGNWLKRFQDATRQEPCAFQSDVYMAQLSHELGRCKCNGLDNESIATVQDVARAASRQVDGQPVATSARHGDFIPQNILVNGECVALSDLENFAESDVIYHDVGTLLAYLTMMQGWPVYSREALQAAQASFLEAYNPCDSGFFLHLYILKAAVTILAEFESSKQGIIGNLHFRSHRQQLRRICEDLRRSLLHDSRP